MVPEFFVGCDLGQVNDPTAICVVSRTERPTGRLERVINIGRWFGSGGGGPAEWTAPQVAAHYEIIHLERVPLGTSYVDIPPRIHEIAARLRQEWLNAVWEAERAAAAAGRSVRHHPTLADAPVTIAIDETGAGRPVFNLFVESGLDPLGVTITGGNATSWSNEREVHVSKRILVSTTQAVLQAKRLKAASELPEWPVLRAELANFRARISLAGSVSFEAGTDEEWRREGTNDDLVLALALSLWAGENGRPQTGEIDPAIVRAFSAMPHWQ